MSERWEQHCICPLKITLTFNFNRVLCVFSVRQILVMRSWSEHRLVMSQIMVHLCQTCFFPGVTFFLMCAVFVMYSRVYLLNYNLTILLNDTVFWITQIFCTNMLNFYFNFLLACLFGLARHSFSVKWCPLNPNIQYTPVYSQRPLFDWK